MRRLPTFTASAKATAVAVVAAVAATAISGLCIRTTAAQPYYVATSPTGNDNNIGSAEAPWATLQHAADSVQPGDSVFVLDGSYTGFQIETSGSSSQRIVFLAAGDNVVVDGVNPVRGDHNINVEGADYVTIDGFHVRDAVLAGIRVVIARGVVIRNNVIGPNGKWGVLTGFAPDVQILDNVTFGSVIEHGIYVSNSDVDDDNPIIRGNTSYGNGANGIQLNGDCYAGGDGTIDGALLEQNLVYDNEHKGFSIISAPGARIQNNVTFNNGLGGAAGGIHLVDEPGCGKPTNDAVVVNNTLIELNIAGIRMTDGATGNVVFNNLIVSGNPISYEVGSNLIDAASNVSRSSVDGLFTGSNSNDYHLAAGSAALEAGTASYGGQDAPATDFDGLARPVGDGYDAGAFERAASVAVEQQTTSTAFTLHPAAPNPFAQVTTIPFELAIEGHALIRLLDIRGRVVATLVDGYQTAGTHSVPINGAALASGVYVVEMRTAEAVRTQMVVRAR